MLEINQDYVDGIKAKIEKNEEDKRKKDLESLDPRVKASVLDLNKKPRPKPIVLSYEYDWKGEPSPLLSAGDYSVLTGLSKSKKTFFRSMIEASYIAGDGTSDMMPFRTHRRGDKILCVIDTEQSVDDQLEAAHRVRRMVGGPYANAKYMDWSLHSPSDRLVMLESFVKAYKNQIGLMILDGFIDFVEDYNNNKECFDFQLKIMEWAKRYEFHICGVLHKNPNGEKMIGHLGSIMERKAAQIISLSKNPENSKQSAVTHERARGRMEFDDFIIEINQGLPYKL